MSRPRFPAPVFYTGPGDPRVPAHVRAAANIPITGDPPPLDGHSASKAPRVPWDVFYSRLDWRQGEHVGIIAPTGQGKTTLSISLLAQRSYVAVFATKPRDDTMDKLIASGYDRYTRWENMPASKSPRRVIWPNARSIEAEENQKKVFADAYGATYREGGWTIFVDEGWYMSEVLSLKKQMRTVWTQGRSLGLSHVVSTQRPTWVPTEMYDQSTHLFFGRNSDDRVVRRIAEIGTVQAGTVRALIPNLEAHQFLYINTRTGKMFRTRAPAP